MDKDSFIAYAREVGEKYPTLQREIQETFELAMYEIEDGGSATHEFELAQSYIEDELIPECN